MSLPTSSLWKYFRGARVSSFPARYRYEIAIYSMYGDLILKFDYVTNDVSTINLGQELGLKYSNYAPVLSRKIKTRPIIDTPKSYYKIFYKRDIIPSTSLKYYVGKTYNGFRIGSLVGIRDGDLVKRQFWGDTDVYYYSNCLIVINHGTTDDKFVLKNGTRIPIEKNKGMYIYKKTSKKIQTRCCILAKCNPNKYVYTGG